MVKHELRNRTLFISLIFFLLSFTLTASLNAQVVIKERVEIIPIKQQFDSRTITEGDGWWIDTCYINTYDSSEVDLTFTPTAIEPGETTIMTVDYNEELHNFLERNITLEPNLGSIVRTGNSEYKYYAPSSTPGDSALVVRIHYEQFQWYCAYGALGQDSIKTNNTLEELQCGCPLWTWTQVNRRYGIDSIMIAWDSLDVKVVPDTIYPGDTAQVIVKKRLPDGTLIDFDSTQTYEVGMLDGCILGNIKTSSDSGYYVYNVTQPIYFIADTSADTTGAVLLRVGLVEQTSKPQDKNSPQKDNAESDCFFGWQSNSYEYVTVVKENPLEIINPTLVTIERITDVPEMPTVVCKARLKKYYPGTIKYEWKYIVRKFYARRTLQKNPVCERISKSEFHGISYSSYGGEVTEWTVPFIKDSGYFYFKSLQPAKNIFDPLNHIYGCNGDTNEWYDTNDEIFTGGEVLITLIAKSYQTGEILARLDTVKLGKILGDDPGKPQIISYTNDNVIRAIQEFESEFKQFEHNANKSWPYNETGWPLYGEPNGYGIMQLDSDPAATERQLWNWKANIDGGKYKFYVLIKEEDTDPFLNKHQQNVTEEMRLKCAYQKYNYYGGKFKTEESYYYKWDGEKLVENDLIPDDRRVINGETKKYGTWVYDIYSEL
jgi:hypothetical protein